ncbi:MAG: aldo/keto reductase [Chloroflexia bacterium]|nr:aldo/keto reductase [Chloroflexia bacterium]
MKYHKFNNGDQIPLLGLGTWKSAPGDVYSAVREAIKAGYRHIDCAHIYENEAEIGRAIKDAISDGEVKREELWITSKLWNNSHGKDNVIPALQKTLADLQLDYLDLYLIHWPVPLKEDKKFAMVASHFYSLEERPISDTWKGMEQAVEQGLTKHIGVSNFSIKKLKDLVANSNIKPEVNQVELHPFLQQKEMLDFCSQENILLTAYSPLGSKDRAANMKGKDEPNLLNNSVIDEIANNRNLSSAQVLLAWAVNRGTAVIPKSVNPERIMENLKAADIILGEKNMDRIDLLDKHFRFINGKFWAVPGSGYTVENLWDE